jgi:hypothetical protein
MVGKPNVYRNEEEILDFERAASMADEGGTSGMLFEHHEMPSQSLLPARSQMSRRWLWIAVGAVSLGAVALYFNLRQRSEPALLPE